ncbi:unnamed protein product [Trypanosoma congolense IL3000]|uniref:WGS project CAEQ00000000 data, annotated contig 743 n=1 Tax=Trypanosoma congolense (strain IL3000) TaxID=1068625 RepID=F9WI80_TRYCI|nr:unnamed protein product [Trypanosoma congolense IL3000]
MSQALECILPPLTCHLTGGVTGEDAVGNGITTNESKAPSCASCGTSSDSYSSFDRSGIAQYPLNVSDPMKGPASSAARTGRCSNLRNSAYRWRRCIEIWRHLLGHDPLFLALLFHSGSLWATEWTQGNVMDVRLGVPHCGDSRKGKKSWAEAVLWFLQLHEGVSVGGGTTGSDDIGPSNTGHVRDWNNKCEREDPRKGGAAFHIHSKDASQVQRAATGLLSEWFSTVDGCGKRFAHAYYLSCAIKIVALVGNASLIEDIPQLYRLVQLDSRFSSHLNAFYSILCCLLVEEAQQQHPCRLSLPPTFFLLNFNVIGRGSRLGVWLPRELTGHKRVGNSIQEGDFYSCVVSSPGVVLRISSSPSATEGAEMCGDIALIIRLLDEADIRQNAALPIVLETEETSPNTGDSRKLPGRGRRQVPQSFLSGGATQPLRCWSATCAATCSFVRMDVANPRNITELLPRFSSSAHTVDNKRSSAQQHLRQGQPHCVAPVRRSSRLSLGRDPLAAVALALSTTARRIVGCRGLFLKKQLVPWVNSSTDVSVANKKNVFSHEENKSQQLHAGEGHTTEQERSLSTSFNQAEEELECVIECSLHLQLQALLLCTTLPQDMVHGFDTWYVEATSNIVDLALGAPWPIVRHLRAVGFAFCLIPPHQQHQSLLIAVGLFATLTQRQEEKNKSHKAGATETKGALKTNIIIGAGWWEIFKICVLHDSIIPAQLHNDIWHLVERSERALRTSHSIRLQNTQNKNSSKDHIDTQPNQNKNNQMKPRLLSLTSRIIPTTKHLINKTREQWNGKKEGKQNPFTARKHHTPYKIISKKNKPTSSLQKKKIALWWKIEINRPP